MSPSMSLNSRNKYEVKISGPPYSSWFEWLGDIEMHVETLADDSQVTVFQNMVMDQAALVGLIRRLHGLGIVLISVRRLDPEPQADGCPAAE